MRAWRQTASGSGNDSDDLSYLLMTMAHRSGQSLSPTARSPVSEGANTGIRITTVNENWRGKNDPAERRRIQNRLNQRAFRHRQRAGESPKQYKPRSMSGPSTQHTDEEDESSPSDLPVRSRSEGPVTSQSTSEQSSGTDTPTGPVWDELAKLINRNLMSAASTNAQHLGIDIRTLQEPTYGVTPRLSEATPPASLTPVELQYQIPHDPILDIIPHARLRFNILKAVATGQVDQSAFCKCIRQSGALSLLNGDWRRGGLVVWSFPEQLASWELSETFIRRWAFLLQGCEDLIAATNAWRSRRGETLLPLSLDRSDIMMWY